MVLSILGISHVITRTVSVKIQSYSYEAFIFSSSFRHMSKLEKQSGKIYILAEAVRVSNKLFGNQKMKLLH